MQKHLQQSFLPLRVVLNFKSQRRGKKKLLKCNTGCRTILSDDIFALDFYQLMCMSIGFASSTDKKKVATYKFWGFYSFQLYSLQKETWETQVFSPQCSRTLSSWSIELLWFASSQLKSQIGRENNSTFNVSRFLLKIAHMDDTVTTAISFFSCW